MRYLQLRLGLPSEVRHPMHQYLRDRTEVERVSLRHWNFSNPEYLTSLLLVVGNGADLPEAYLAALDAVETVTEYDTTRVDDRRFYVYVRETTPTLARRLRPLFADTELLIVPPVEFDPGGVVHLEVVGSQDALRRLLVDVPDDVSVSVARLGEYDVHRESRATALTDRQREVFDVAREYGYYEIPRETSVREIAEVVGCAKSTAANHLRKIEARLATLYDDQTTGGGSESSPRP